jgi:hypothetical protein
MRERIASRTFRNPAGSITIFSRVVLRNRGSRASSTLQAPPQTPTFPIFIAESLLLRVRWIKLGLNLRSALIDCNGEPPLREDRAMCVGRVASMLVPSQTVSET